MSFRIKKCLFCETFKPLGMYHANPSARDGYWGWCKECEKRYGYSQKKNEIGGKCNYVVSFSGGKDSTAMLLKLIEDKRKIDAVVYFDCGSFEWPQMADHIDRIEKDTGLKIIKIHPFMDFYEQATTLLPRNKEINGWPTPMMRWCTMQKINLIKQAMRPFRPYVQYIGFSSDENDRVLKASISGNNVKRDHFMNNEFPLVEWGMTEKDCLKYCLDRGYTWGGLYDHFSRVSCWCCPLQNHSCLPRIAGARLWLLYYPTYDISLVVDIDGVAVDIAPGRSAACTVRDPAAVAPYAPLLAVGEIRCPAGADFGIHCDLAHVMISAADRNTVFRAHPILLGSVCGSFDPMYILYQFFLL